MSPVLAGLFAAGSSLLAYAAYLTREIYGTWKSRGVLHEEPVLFLGNSLRTVLKRTSHGERIKEVCDKFPEEQVVGFYDFMRPILIIKDARLAENVLIEDFSHFADRGFQVDERRNPLDVNLSNMTGRRWRALRNKLLPVFTAGKLRVMFQQMTEICCSLEKVIDVDNVCLELKDVMGRFAMDVISSFALGIDAGTLANPRSQFRTIGKRAFEFKLSLFVRLVVLTNFPNLAKRLGIGFNRKEVQDYFAVIIRNTIRHRRENNVRRNDLIDLMMDLIYRGPIKITTKGEELLKTDSYATDTFELTDDLLVGQALDFLTAGFEATAATTTLACYEFTKNDEIQERARKEVIETVRQHGGLCFDSVKEMNYLDMCLKETMRKYPPTQMLFRVCTKEYTFSNGLTVKPGETVLVSTLSIHRDPEYYPDPMKFDPERFGPEVFQRPGTYIPFGDGPRICIARRFAVQQMKFGLAKILNSYRLKLNPKTKEPLVINKRIFITVPEAPVYFDLEKIGA